MVSLVPAYNENGTARHYNVNKW